MVIPSLLPPGQRVGAGGNLRPPGGPWPVLPDLQRVEAVAQRALLGHLPAQPGHQRPGRPLPAGRTSHDPHTLLHRDTCVRKRRETKTELTHTHTHLVPQTHTRTHTSKTHTHTHRQKHRALH